MHRAAIYYPNIRYIIKSEAIIIELDKAIYKTHKRPIFTKTSTRRPTGSTNNIKRNPQNQNLEPRNHHNI
jgi:hypothetical protein